MKVSGMLATAKTNQWLPVERLLFVVCLATAVRALLVIGVLEFSEQSNWFEIRKEEQEFTRSLPTKDEIHRIAKQLPTSAVRFSSQYPIINILGGPPVGYRKYVGYYDPICQQKAEAKSKVENSNENIFLLPIKRPAEECVLWSYGDHYLGSVSKVYWHLDKLADSISLSRSRFFRLRASSTFFSFERFGYRSCGGIRG